MNPNSVLQPFTLPCWAYAYGAPNATGEIKRQVEDFRVDEQLPFKPDGYGEHAFVHIEKRGENTEYVARALARISGVRQRDIGFAGLKDRHALTTQWFSVWLPGKEDPDWTEIETDAIKILQTSRHSRKLKRGALVGNEFQILVRNFSGDQAHCEQQLENIKTEGFPNYFGRQRFGRQGNNITTALALFEGTQKIKRQQRGIYLSATRSFLFNEVLSHRIETHCWNQALDGDILMFSGSNSYFKITSLDETTRQRLENKELHPTGCLYGKGDLLTIETPIISKQAKLALGLVTFGLEADRRVLRIVPQNLQWQFVDSQQLQLRFFLNVGSYATALLREIIDF